MKPGTRPRRARAAIVLLSAVLSALAGACGELPPTPPEASATVDGGAPTADTATAPNVTPGAVIVARVPGVTRGDAGPADDARVPGVETSAPTVGRCDALPELGDPRNTIANGSGFVLTDVLAARDERRTGCATADWQHGTDATVRFTSPDAARWRLSVSGRRPLSSSVTVSVHDGCAAGAPGALVRCAPYTGSLVVALEAGRSVTLVVDGCREAEPCRFDLRAERITASATVPELTDVHVYRSARGVVVVGRASDADGDLSLVDADWLDDRGAVLPRTDGRPRSEVPWSFVSVRGDLRYTLYHVSDRAVRARVWVEDATALASAARDVPIEAPPVRAAGEACDPDGGTSTCDVNTRCIYNRGTGHTCVARLVARHDGAAGSLRIDLDAHDLAMASAEVAFLDAAGAELARTGQFLWAPGCCAYSTLVREVLVAYDGWRAPTGLARVRVSVIDRAGLPMAALEAPVEPPASVGPWLACDATTTARVRCDDALVCVSNQDSTGGYRCRAREAACPPDWQVRRWAPSANTGASVLEAGTAVARQWSPPTCLGAASWSSTQDVIDFVAPVAGTYRFALTAPSAPARYDFALSARRYCALVGAAAELACDAAGARTRTSALEVTVAAGEHVPLLVSSIGAALSYRLEVVPPSAR